MLVDNTKVTKINWIEEFLTQKSHLPKDDNTIKILFQAMQSKTLEGLVQDRYLDGKRFAGWTTDGSKGFTDISTGDIFIKKTGTGSEPVTLAYECINSKNRHLYKKLGIKYAFEEDTPDNRGKFAEEVLNLEAQAQFIKCKFLTEIDKRELGQEHYLKVYDDDSLEEVEKVKKLKEVMMEKGVVHDGAKKAYDFYKSERYDEFVTFYRNEIRLGKVV